MLLRLLSVDPVILLDFDITYMSRVKTNKEKLGVRGFFRLQVTDDGKVVGDSGWRENQVLNLGIQDYIVQWVCAGSGGKAVTHMAIGTGGAPASADTTIAGQVTDGKRAAVSTSIVSSRTAQFTAAFNSSDSFLTASANISNVGLVFLTLDQLKLNYMREHLDRRHVDYFHCKVKATSKNHGGRENPQGRLPFKGRTLRDYTLSPFQISGKVKI